MKIVFFKVEQVYVHLAHLEVLTLILPPTYTLHLKKTLKVYNILGSETTFIAASMGSHPKQTLNLLILLFL